MKFLTKNTTINKLPYLISHLTTTYEAMNHLFIHHNFSHKFAGKHDTKRTPKKRENPYFSLYLLCFGFLTYITTTVCHLFGRRHNPTCHRCSPNTCVTTRTQPHQHPHLLCSLFLAFSFSPLSRAQLYRTSPNCSVVSLRCCWPSSSTSSPEPELVPPVSLFVVPAPSSRD